MGGSRQLVPVWQKPKQRTVRGTWHCNLTGHPFLKISPETRKPPFDPAGILTQRRITRTEQQQQQTLSSWKTSSESPQNQCSSNENNNYKTLMESGFDLRRFYKAKRRKRGCERAGERESSLLCINFFGQQQVFPRCWGIPEMLMGKCVILCLCLYVCVRTRVCYSIIYHCNLENIVEREVIIHVKWYKNRPLPPLVPPFSFKRLARSGDYKI